MILAFPWPLSTGEWLAFTSAALTFFWGFLLLAAPRLALGLLRLQPRPAHPEAVGEARSTLAGFYLGVGLCCMLTGQFWIYLALGFSWCFTAFGRLVSILSDKGVTLFNGVRLLAEIFLAMMALAFALGFVS